MEKSEIEPVRTNVSNGANLPPKQDDDDFGPETDVDALDDSNPFGTDCWTRPDPVQSLNDFTGLKAPVGMRGCADFCTTGLDNPFYSNSLDDIAEEKYVREYGKFEKEEDVNSNGIKDGLSNGTHKSENQVKDIFGFDPLPDSVTNGSTENGAADNLFNDSTKNLLESEDLITTELKEPVKELENFGFDTTFSVESSAIEVAPVVQQQTLDIDITEVQNSLPDVVAIVPDTDFLEPQTISPFCNSEIADNVLDVTQEHDKNIEKEIEDTNAFERSTPEPNEDIPPVDDKSGLQLDPEGPVQLETLKNLILEDDHNVDEFENGIEPAEDEPICAKSDDPSHIPVTASTDVEPPVNQIDQEEAEFDAGLTADDAVETVEGDESEEEWNYYKVDQKPPASPDMANMNSPLNPYAAEFVPVSPTSERQTPVKSVINNISEDVMISSPNWANMDAVEVPDEEEFLLDVQSRPCELNPDVKPFKMPSLVGTDLPEKSDSPNLLGDGNDDILATELPPDTENDLKIEERLVGALESAVEDEIPKIEEKNIDLVAAQGPEVVDDLVENLVEKVEEEKAVVDAFDLIDKIESTDSTAESSIQQIKEESVVSNDLIEEPVVIESIAEPVVAVTEPRGLDLATDMTSSFIDPSTMSQDPETPEIAPVVPEPEPQPELKPEIEVAPPSAPEATEEVVAAPAPVNENLIEVAETVSQVEPNVAATVAAVAATGVVAGVTAAAASKSTAKSTPLKAATKTAAKTPTAATPKAGTPVAAKKPATPTAARTPVSKSSATRPSTASAAASPRPRPSSAAKPSASPAAATKLTSTVSARPATSVAAKPKPASTATAPKVGTNTTAAPKPAVKSTIPPRTAVAAPKPRVPPKTTATATNGDVKPATKRPESAPVKKPATTLANRVPLSARTPSAATSTNKTATAATKPATTAARPASARTTTSTATKSSTVPPTKKPVSAAAKVNGVTKVAPVKRAVPATKTVENKTDGKTAPVVSNGVSASE